MNKFLIALFISTCVFSTAWADNISVEVIQQPNQQWQFQRLNAFTSNNTISVLGRLTYRHSRYLPRGHVDVAAFSTTGELLATTTTDYTPSVLTRRAKRRGGVRFSTTFEQSLPADSIIKVAFHRDEPKSTLKPLHGQNQNLAR
mgnify:FL=1